MDKAVLKERAFLAVMAGQASATDAGAAPVGARLEAKARAGWQPTAVRGQVRAPDPAAPAPRGTRRLSSL